MMSRMTWCSEAAVTEYFLLTEVVPRMYRGRSFPRLEGAEEEVGGPSSKLRGRLRLTLLTSFSCLR